jgi:ferredoxin
MPKTPKVDPNTCIACGTCTSMCPNTFKTGEDGKSQVQNPQGESEEQIQGAIDACPVHAISWEGE